MILLLALLASPASFETGAAAALAELGAACTAERGEIWGVSLCGPTLIVEPGTRGVIANAADREGALAPFDGAFAGSLPDDLGLANTAIEWAGIRWSMVLWPLPENRQRRLALLLHESWHRVQPELGFPGPMVQNAHLVEIAGRLWLRLEGQALRRALETDGEDRRAAARDALSFRGYRYALFPEAEAEETALELNEGLASYTGIRAASRTGATAAAVEALADADARADLSRSFAYATGPAWGLLLDELHPGWRNSLLPATNFGALAAPGVDSRWPVPPVAEEVISGAARSYGFVRISTEEERRAADTERELARLRRELVDDPALVLPLAQIELQFDPNGVVPLAPHGTVYRNLTASDRWGRIEVNGAALIGSDFSALALGGMPEIDGRTVTAPGWRLELAKGWTVDRSGSRPWSLRSPEDAAP